MNNQTPGDLSQSVFGNRAHRINIQVWEYSVSPYLRKLQRKGFSILFTRYMNIVMSIFHVCLFVCHVTDKIMWHTWYTPTPFARKHVWDSIQSMCISRVRDGVTVRDGGQGLGWVHARTYVVHKMLCIQSIRRLPPYWGYIKRPMGRSTAITPTRRFFEIGRSKFWVHYTAFFRPHYELPTTAVYPTWEGLPSPQTR